MCIRDSNKGELTIQVNNLPKTVHGNEDCGVLFFICNSSHIGQFNSLIKSAIIRYFDVSEHLIIILKMNLMTLNESIIPGRAYLCT